MEIEIAKKIYQWILTAIIIANALFVFVPKIKKNWKKKGVLYKIFMCRDEVSNAHYITLWLHLMLSIIYYSVFM